MQFKKMRTLLPFRAVAQYIFLVTVPLYSCFGEQLSIERLPVVIVFLPLISLREIVL